MSLRGATETFILDFLCSSIIFINSFIEYPLPDAILKMLEFFNSIHFIIVLATSFQIINKETTFESLSLNSLTYISIIVSLEDEFDIEFEEDYLLQDTITTVDDIIEHIKSVTLTENKMQNKTNL